MRDPKRIIHEALGWKPDIDDVEISEGGLVRVAFSSKDDLVSGELVISDAADAAVIRVGEADEQILAPLDGPRDFDLRIVVSVTNEAVWSRFVSLGGSAASEALFGSPPSFFGLSWGSASFERRGKTGLITLPVSVTNRPAAAAHVREVKAHLGEPDWIPSNMRDLAFAAAVGHSDFALREEFGFEITHSEAWEADGDLRRALREASDAILDTDFGCWSIDHVAEGDVVMAFVSEPSWHSSLITHRSGVGHSVFQISDAVRLMKGASCTSGMEP